MGVWGATPQPYFFLALCISNTTFPGIQKHVCWPMEYSGMGVWRATPEPNFFFGIVHFKHHLPRYPAACLLAYGVQWYGCLWRHSRTETIFLALCISNTTIPGTQKHVCWPLEYCGMGVWAATPEPEQYFWHCAFQTPPFQVPQNTFAGLWSTVVWVFGAPPQNPNNVFWHSAFQTPLSQVPKNTFAGLWSTMVWVFGPPPQNPNNIFCHCAFQTPPSQVAKNTFAGLWSTVVWVFGPPPQNPNNVFWHCAFQTPPSQVPKNTFAGLWSTVVWVFGAPPHNPIFF